MNDPRFEGMLRRHVEERLLAPRAMEDVDFQLVEPPAGVTTTIRLVEIEGHSGFAVRVYPRFQRWRAVKRLATDRLIVRRLLPAPRLVDCHIPPLWLGPSIVTEERLEGRHIKRSDWTADLARRLAETLGKLHTVSSPWHGSVEKASRKSFFSVAMARAQHRLDGIRRRRDGSEMTTGDMEEIERWFFSWEGRFAKQSRFDLTHDKLNTGNILWRDDEGAFALLDFETLHYGCLAKDLVQTEHDMFGEDAATVDAFYHAYWPRIPAEACETAKNVLPFYHAYYHLSETATCLKRSRKTKKKPMREGYRNKAKEHWTATREVVGQ